MASSGDKYPHYLDLLEDEDESDNDDDVNWKRKKSPPTSTPDVSSVRSRCTFSDSGDSKRVSPPQVSRSCHFDEQLPPTVRTITRKIDGSLSASNVSEMTTPSKPVWKRLSFPEIRTNRSPSPPSVSPRVIVTSIKPPSSLASGGEPRPTVRKLITPPSPMNTKDLRTKIVSTPSEANKMETPPNALKRPPIPDTLDFKPPFAPPRPKYERDVDLATFLKQIRAEMIALVSLDRIYSRSIRELAAMKAVPEFQSVIKRVVEGVLFDPEVQLNEDTVHKVLKVLDLFDLDNPSTWTYLVDQCQCLIIRNVEDHYVRLSKFIEMVFNHLFVKKTRLPPTTALALYKLAQVRPFDPEKKPSPRVKLESIRADLSGLQSN